LVDRLMGHADPEARLHTHFDHWVVKEWNTKPAFRIIAAVVVSVVTYGAASEAVFAEGSTMAVTADGAYVVTATQSGLLAGAVSSGTITASTAATIAAAAGGAAGAIASDAVRGTSFNTAMKDGLIGAVTAGVSSGVLHDLEGDFFLHTGGHALWVVRHKPRKVGASGLASHRAGLLLE